MNPHLIARRKAAHTLNMLTANLGFGSKAEKWLPDDISQWDVYGERLVIAKRNITVVARIELLEGTKRHLTIPRWDGLIRTEHLSDFDPSHHGLVENTSEDVIFREKLPDSEGYVDFGDPLGLDLPAQIMERETRYRAPKVVM